MDAKQNHPHNGQRQQSKETNLPPPYPQTVDENTPFLQQDGLQVIKAPLPPIVSATQAATSTTSQPTELYASQVWGEALADPKAHVGTTEITTELTPRRHEATELQRMTMELQNVVHKAVHEALADPKARVGTTETTTELTPKRHEATDSQRRIIEAQNRTIEIQNKTINEQLSIIEYQNATREAQKTTIGCKDRYIDYLRQMLQSVSAKVAAEEALPEKEQEETLSDLRYQLHRRQVAQVHVSEVVHELLDILKT